LLSSLLAHRASLAPSAPRLLDARPTVRRLWPRSTSGLPALRGSRREVHGPQDLCTRCLQGPLPHSVSNPAFLLLWFHCFSWCSSSFWPSWGEREVWLVVLLLSRFSTWNTGYIWFVLIPFERTGTCGKQLIRFEVSLVNKVQGLEQQFALGSNRTLEIQNHQYTYFSWTYLLVRQTFFSAYFAVSVFYQFYWLCIEEWLMVLSLTWINSLHITWSSED